MSGQIVRIGVTCAAIVLGTALIGSQLSTSGKFVNLVPKSAEEDEAGAIESADADDDARSGQDEELAEAETADERQADEESAEDDVASDESEADETSAAYFAKTPLS